MEDNHAISHMLRDSESEDNLLGPQFHDKSEKHFLVTFCLSSFSGSSLYVLAFILVFLSQRGSRLKSRSRCVGEERVHLGNMRKV